MQTRVFLLIVLAGFTALGTGNADTVVVGGPGPERVRATADAIGPTPLAEMTMYTGRSFDWQYMVSMYRQNSGIAAIAAIGACRATCQPLRELSARIAQEQIALNVGLDWASLKFANAPKPGVCAKRFTDLMVMLNSCPAQQFDRVYAMTMIVLMRQSADAAQRAILQTQDDEDEGHIQAQAHATWRVNSEESSRLRRYL